MKTYKIEYGNKRESFVKYYKTLKEAEEEFVKIQKILFRKTEDPDRLKRIIREGTYVKLYSKKVGLWTLEESMDSTKVLEDSKENEMTNTNKANLKKMINKSNYTEILEFLQELLDEEQEKYDNLSESAQESEYGEKLAGNIEKLEEAVDAFENLDSCVSELNDQVGLKLYE